MYTGTEISNMIVNRKLGLPKRPNLRRREEGNAVSHKEKGSGGVG